MYVEQILPFSHTEFRGKSSLLGPITEL